MSSSVSALAPAKINLGLKVLPKRADGFHDIVSIFSTVDLCDSITVTSGGKKNTCLVECEGMKLPENNTITLAYKAFCVLTGVDEGVHVSLKKCIPAGGGLGGGSSDASSFLHLIDTLFCTHLNKSSYMELSGSVGSDVFFFTEALLAKEQGRLKDGRFAAVVTGRGENVRQIDARNDFSVLLVFPGVSVSTKEAYALVDEAHCKSAFHSEESVTADSLEEIYRRPIQEWFFLNDFTSPVEDKFREIRAALDELRESGADFADMSGSGSTVFGIFTDVECARQALNVISKRWKAVLL